MDWASMITVGRIIRPHGNRGAVVIAPETDFADDRFRIGETVHVFRAGALEPLVVETSREYRGRWVVGFAGLATIDDAEKLRGFEARIPESALRPLPQDAYYVHQLVGCDVRTASGESVGAVVRVDDGSGAPMLVIDGRGEVLVPFVAGMVLRVDLEGKVIEINPPEGLIELNRKASG